MSYTNRRNELKCHRHKMPRLILIFDRLPVEDSWCATQNAEWSVEAPPTARMIR
jgi:hypothetical protein